MSAPDDSQAAHQADAGGFDIPPWGKPAARNSTIPAANAIAPSATRAVTR